MTHLAKGSLRKPVFCIKRIKVSCILVGTSKTTSSILGLTVVVVTTSVVVVVAFVGFVGFFVEVVSGNSGD